MEDIASVVLKALDEQFQRRDRPLRISNASQNFKTPLAWSCVVTALSNAVVSRSMPSEPIWIATLSSNKNLT